MLTTLFESRFEVLYLRHYSQQNIVKMELKKIATGRKSAKFEYQIVESYRDKMKKNLNRLNSIAYLIN